MSYNIFKIVLKKISRFLYLFNRVFYHLVPDELKKKSDIRILLEKNLAQETFQVFGDIFKKTLLFQFNDSEVSGKPIKNIRKYAITESLKIKKPSDQNDDFFYLELGVYKGTSANYFSSFVKTLYVFDSFEGLRENWSGTDLEAGYLSLNKKLPKLNSNIIPTVGWVENTLEPFLIKTNPKIAFVHFDMDTYSPTKYALEKIKPYLVKDSIIIFDDMINYIGWQEGEYKALNDVFAKNEFIYKAFDLDGGQCVIQIR